VLLVLALAGCTADPEPLGPAVPTGPDPDGAETAKVFTDTFRLRAYDLDSVHVAGTLNGWADEDSTWALTLQPDGYTWELAREVPDVLHQFKYVIRKDGESAWLTNPDAKDILPDGFHGSPSYWNEARGRDFPTPDPLPAPIPRNQLVIYEISLNDFSASGSFTGAIANLTAGADLADLGVNALQLMPITAPSYNGWGYDPVLQAAPNGAFGWPIHFAYFVDAAHDLGMAVILDVVVNHMAGSAPLRQLDDFTGTYRFTTTESNPWGLVELNWSDPALREHIVESLSHWVTAYNVDGFRFDYIGGEPYATWVWLRDQLLTRHPDLLLIAEDFSYVANSVSYGFDAQWGGQHTDPWGGGGNNFNQVLATALSQNGFSSRGTTAIQTGAWGPAYNNMWAVANVISGNSQYAGGNPGDGFSDVKYLESHDENRVVWYVNNVGSPGAQAIGGIRKAHLGAVVSLTSVGIPMLFNGQEIGSGEWRNPSPVTYKVDWNNGDAGVRQTYKTLIDWRLNLPALQSENIFFHWRDGNVDQVEATLVYWRGSTNTSADAEVVVACNFDHLDHELTVPFPRAGTWVRFDPYAGWVMTEVLETASLTLDLPASTALVWVRQNATTGVPLGPLPD
jgi:1,4-alpha-glucan branching enzyme